MDNLSVRVKDELAPFEQSSLLGAGRERCAVRRLLMQLLRLRLPLFLCFRLYFCAF